MVAKLEANDPSRSIKDRIAISMLDAAEQKGLIGPETLFLEPTGINTGIGLALVCAAKGYQCTMLMPDSVSVERNSSTAMETARCFTVC